MLYRVKQFLWAIGSNFKEIDYKYVDKFFICFPSFLHT